MHIDIVSRHFLRTNTHTHNSPHTVAWLHGTAVSVNEEKALKCFEKAANAGYVCMYVFLRCGYTIEQGDTLQVLCQGTFVKVLKIAEGAYMHVRSLVHMCAC